MSISSQRRSVAHASFSEAPSPSFYSSRLFSPESPRASRGDPYAPFREEKLWSAVRTSNHTNVYLEKLQSRKEWVPFEPSPLDKNVSQKQCGLCELYFPKDALPGTTVRSSIRNWREERLSASTLPTLKCSPRTTGQKFKFTHEYDVLPLCCFCHQFFTKCAKIDTDEDGHPLKLSPERKCDVKVVNVVSRRHTELAQRSDVSKPLQREELRKKEVWKYQPNSAKIENKPRRPMREKHVEGRMFPSRPASARKSSCGTQTEQLHGNGKKKRRKRKKKRVKKKASVSSATPKPKWIQAQENAEGKRRIKRPQSLFNACLALQVKKKLERLRIIECKEMLENRCPFREVERDGKL